MNTKYIIIFIIAVITLTISLVLWRKEKKKEPKIRYIDFTDFR